LFGIVRLWTKATDLFFCFVFASCKTPSNFKFTAPAICSCVSDRFSLRDATFGSSTLCNINVIFWRLPVKEEFHVTDKYWKDGYCSMYVTIMPVDAVKWGMGVN
jgi:hypothetical protein